MKYEINKIDIDNSQTRRRKKKIIKTRPDSIVLNKKSKNGSHENYC